MEAHLQLKHELILSKNEFEKKNEESFLMQEKHWSELSDRSILISSANISKFRP